VERIRAQIDPLFTTDRDLGEVVEDVARLGARLLLQDLRHQLTHPPTLGEVVDRPVTTAA
jgi:hypothetical protein